MVLAVKPIVMLPPPFRRTRRQRVTVTGGPDATAPAEPRADRSQPQRLSEAAEFADQDRASSWSVRHLGLYRMLYVSMITGNVMDRYQSIAWQLGLPAERSRATACRAIRSEITRQVQEARPLPVLVVDEAQVLHTDLRLVGLTEWRRRLSMAVHASLSQRLVVHHHLGGRQRDELDAYLAHRRTAAHPQGGLPSVLRHRRLHALRAETGSQLRAAAMALAHQSDRADRHAAASASSASKATGDR